MRTILISLPSFFAGLIVVIGLCSPAGASDCSALSYAVDDAFAQMKRATKARDLEDAKGYARRSKNALEEASYAAGDCGCDDAQAEFDSAATYARRAHYADDVDDFVDNMNRSIRTFNTAIEAVNMCRGKGE